MPPRRERDRPPPSQRQYVRQPVPRFVEFQHPRLVSAPPAGQQWLHEVKLDGYRLQVRVEDHQATIYTRRGHDWTGQLPELAQCAAELPDCILDGELCHLDAAGKPTFSGLRAAIGRKQTKGLVFFAFDLLWRGQDDLRTFPLADRKEMLAGLLEDLDAARIRYVEPLPYDGQTLMVAACRMGLEGIVSKRRDARYAGGRGEGWVKSKCHLAQEFVIGGWVQEKGRHMKSLLLGVYQGGKLTYVGSVEHGLSRAGPDLERRLEALATRTRPFAAGAPPSATSPGVRWAEPRLVAQVQFQEWTASGKVRHASFQHLRDDKDPAEVKRERPAATPF
jgi:bifunctional non-homologous end joining protein LigD